MAKKILTEGRKRIIQGYLEALHFVMWDRYVPISAEDICFYGWIDRKDTRKDFITLTFDMSDDESYGYGYVTSSASMDSEISRILELDGCAEQHRCVRIEGDFNIKNSVKLKKKTYESKNKK